MNESPSEPTAADGSPPAPPVTGLRDELTKTITAANRLRSILATVNNDRGRRLGQRQ